MSILVAIYFKDKKNKIASQYHQFKNKIESIYGFIHHKETLKFHGETTQAKFVKTNMNQKI
tara:strand:- start:1192 stop:1374 length:183 start_codon:yes stop_codon:yes gene_type:complete